MNIFGCSHPNSPWQEGRDSTSDEPSLHLRRSDGMLIYYRVIDKYRICPKCGITIIDPAAVKLETVEIGKVHNHD